MRPLLGCWMDVAGRIRGAASIVLFTDFDGTLAPLVARPEDARITGATRAALARLAAHPRVRVFVISGRGRADLKARMTAPGVPCLGAFGWDSGAEQLPTETLRRLCRARLEVAARLNGTPGVRVEDKGVSFALDYRGADGETGRRARRELDEVLARFRGTLQAVPGDHVLEVLPREIRGKGHAARRWWRLHAPGALPIYLGNDATDEPAFKSLAGGITARVGRRGSTRAHYFLRSPAEVERFLEGLEKEIR